MLKLGYNHAVSCMGTHIDQPKKIRKTIWKNVGIPELVFERIKKVIVFTGHPSVAETMQKRTFFVS